MRRLLLFIFTILFLFMILVFFEFSRFDDRKLHMVFCDIGQGDAIYIRTPENADILIDGGPNSAVLDCLSRNMPFWDRTIDMVIMTHPDADHSTGLIDVINRYKVMSFYTESVPGTTGIFKVLEATLADKNLSASFLTDQDKFREKSGFSMEVLWPTQDAIERISQNKSDPSLNDVSVVTLVKYGKFKALLTGDAGKAVESVVDDEAGDIDVLKVPHHGSGTGFDEAFLAITKPELAVISVGKNNRYHHPAKNILDMLKANNVKTIRTDISGEFSLETDGIHIDF